MKLASEVERWSGLKDQSMVVECSYECDHRHLGRCVMVPIHLGDIELGLTLRRPLLSYLNKKSANIYYGFPETSLWIKLKVAIVLRSLNLGVRKITRREQSRESINGRQPSSQVSSSMLFYVRS
jgi:hypothetical protein